MKIFFLMVFALCVVHATVGNAAVAIILRRRHVPFEFWRSGMPFYLYKCCNRATPPAGKALCRFALSTNVAGLVAIVDLLPMFASLQYP